MDKHFDAIKAIEFFLRERNWEPKRASSIAKSISIEAAELLELFQWDDATFDEVRADASRLEKIKKELADVLIYSYQMAMFLDVDVQKIVLEKLKLLEVKYPVEAVEEDGYTTLRDDHREGL